MKTGNNHIPELPFWPCAPPPLCVFACSRSPAEPRRTTAGTGQRCQRTRLAASCQHPHRSALLPSGTGTKEKGAHGIRFTAGHSATMFYSVFDCFTGGSLGLSSLKSEQGTSSRALKPVLTQNQPATDYSRVQSLEPEPKLRQRVCRVFFTVT